jgi:hypothetical protein
LSWVEAKRFSPEENKILRYITWDLADVVTGNEVPEKGRWRFHKEIIQRVRNNYASNITGITKSRRMRLVDM